MYFPKLPTLLLVAAVMFVEFSNCFPKGGNENSKGISSGGKKTTANGKKKPGSKGDSKKTDLKAEEKSRVVRNKEDNIDTNKIGGGISFGK